MTDEWQQRVRQERTSQSLEQVYREKFGDEDYERACEVRKWLRDHPRQEDLRAFIAARDPFSAAE